MAGAISHTGSADVLVIGAGAIGLATAVALLEAGRGVHVLDASHPGAGASHGNCGTITPSHAPPLAGPGVIGRALSWMLTPDAPLYIKPRLDPALWAWLLKFAARCNPDDWRRSSAARAVLLDDSRGRLQDWITRHGLDCEFSHDGLDYVFRDPRNFAHHVAECEALRGMGIASTVIDGRAYEIQQPAFREGLAGAIHFPGDAHLRPDRYIAELARTVRALGGHIVEGTRVDDIEETTDGVRVHASLGAWRAKTAIVATGAWSPALAKRLGLRLPIQPGKGYSITYSRPGQVPTRPVVLKDRMVCVTAWESGFRVGSTMEFSGYDDSLNPRRLAALERASAEHLVDPLGPSVAERWSGWRPMTWDDVPVLGRSPRHRHVWLAAGHGMLGISMSAASGQLMADLVEGKTTAIDPAPYAVERFQ